MQKFWGSGHLTSAKHFAYFLQCAQYRLCPFRIDMAMDAIQVPPPADPKVKENVENGKRLEHIRP